MFVYKTIELYIQIKEKLKGQSHGPEGMVFDKTVPSIGLISKSLLFLQEEMELTSNVNLQSFLTGQVEHFHSTTHLKFDTPTMAQKCNCFSRLCDFISCFWKGSSSILRCVTAHVSLADTFAMFFSPIKHN
jgi:hypothetical protein